MTVKVSLNKDIVFKTIILLGPIEVKQIFKRMLEYISLEKIDINDFFNIGSNELGKLKYDDIAKKVDLLFRDQNHKVYNLEMNRVFNEPNIKIDINKAISYAGSCVGSFYSVFPKKDKYYKNDIKVVQFNFNTYYNQVNKDLEKTMTIPINVELNKYDGFVKIYNIYLPRLKDLADTKKEDIYNDFALFMCKEVKEMKKYIKGNKEREVIVNYLTMLEENRKFLNLMSRDEYQKMLERNEGINEGIEQKTKEDAINFYKNGVSKQLIMKSLNITKKQLEIYLENIE